MNCLFLTLLNCSQPWCQVSPSHHTDLRQCPSLGQPSIWVLVWPKQSFPSSPTLLTSKTSAGPGKQLSLVPGMSEISPRVLCSVMGPSPQQGHWTARTRSEKSNKAGEGTGKQDLQGVTEEMEVVFSPKRRRLRGHLSAATATVSIAPLLTRGRGEGTVAEHREVASPSCALLFYPPAPSSTSRLALSPARGTGPRPSWLREKLHGFTIMQLAQIPPMQAKNHLSVQTHVET